MRKPTKNAAQQKAAVPDQKSVKEQKNKYTFSGGLPAWLASNKMSIATTSYQSGKLYFIGANPKGGIMIHERFYRKAMGLSSPKPGTLMMASLYQTIRFENVIKAGELANEVFDACFVPRKMWITGELDLHDIGLMDNGDPIFVGTRWNCLATVSEKYSFKELWKPPFVSALVKEDRCHLNGMAMGEGDQSGTPVYVTACSRSDTVDGWRDRRSDGGVIVEVATGKIVAEGLSMPHSPRLVGGKLYVLNSGTGQLGWIDFTKPAAEAFQPIAFCPGFTRGLAIRGNKAIIGLSKPRYARFDGLQLSDELVARDSEAWCGIQVIDMPSGTVDHWFRIDGPVAELYDVCALEGTSCPMALSFATDEVATFVVPEPVSV